MPSQDDGQQRRIGGRYLLSTLLGSGAMGTVWSGFDEVLRRRVAVKELKVPPGVPAHEAEDMRERIMREARALGGLSHPNIITVYDVVVDDNAPVVVLEMVPSRDLATMINENGALTVQQAAVIGFTTAGALRAAHRSGITHRDVKPGNVLVADDGRVKLTDFGIARNVADAPMTSVGLVLGSPAYIAPEVAAGQPVTTAADLWGLGATLFAATEGRPPYDVQGDPVRTITEVVDGAVPRPRVTGPVAEVIAALMVKDPDRRMALDEVRRRLRPLIIDPDDPVYPGSPDAPTLASPITLRPVGGGAAADRRPAPASPATPRPSPSDTGPPSLVKSERAGPRPGGSSGPRTGSTGSSGVPPRPRPGVGSGGYPRVGSGTGGQPRVGGPSEPGSRPGGPAAASPAPLAAAPGPLPSAFRSAPTGGAAGAGDRAPAPAAPLAMAPGPLPSELRATGGTPDDQPTGATGATGATGWVAVGLVIAGAAVVLAGIATGWAVTRAVSGESPWTTVNVTSTESR